MNTEKVSMSAMKLKRSVNHHCIPIVNPFDVFKVRRVLKGRVLPIQLLHPPIQIRIVVTNRTDVRLSCQERV